jgi:multiple sugar transport system substrate-binding protein
MDRRRALALLAASGVVAAGCDGPSARRRDEPRPPGKLRLAFAHQPLWGDPAPFRALLADFARAHSDVELVTQELPNASDVAHQYFLTALEGGARDLDVFVLDVVFAPELARAGWIADLSESFPPDALKRDFLSGPVDAVILDGRAYAVPWYVDVGVLYRRTDLAPEPPRTYDELESTALAFRARQPDMNGYVWQGRQYEGLVCNAYEAIWGHGGESTKDGRVLLDTPEAALALGYLRGLVVRGVSPKSVLSQAEEESRRVFQDGRAVFMRNWPYAYVEAQKEGSAVRGRVAVSALPTKTGEPGAGALGGYQLAVNASTPDYKRDAALALVRHLTSHEAQAMLAAEYGRNPARRSPYDDPRVRERAPFVASLLPLVERARPRPVTPYWALITDAIQGELSAAVSGIRSPADALRRAQALVDHVTEAR